jgi:hypothetical protein
MHRDGARFARRVDLAVPLGDSRVDPRNVPKGLYRLLAWPMRFAPVLGDHVYRRERVEHHALSILARHDVLVPHLGVALPTALRDHGQHLVVVGGGRVAALATLHELELALHPWDLHQPPLVVIGYLVDRATYLTHKVSTAEEYLLASVVGLVHVDGIVLGRGVGEQVLQHGDLVFKGWRGVCVGSQRHGLVGAGSVSRRRPTLGRLCGTL